MFEAVQIIEEVFYLTFLLIIVAAANVRRELGRVGAVVSKIEWLLAHLGVLPSAEPSRGALSPA